MAQLLSGECLCGKIKFSGETEIKRVANCHCIDCQKTTGAAFATIVFVNDENIKIKGSPRKYSHKSDRGSKMDKHFCENCGSQMFTVNSSRPGIIGLRAGTLNQKHLIKPGVNVFTDSKIPSTKLNLDLPSYSKMPE